jgi:carbon monoxide dehydrogenase subunit G
MQIKGQIKIACPAPLLVQVLNDPGAMAKLLPNDTKLSLSSPGSFAFSVSKAMGPIKLTLPGTMTVIPTGNRQDQKLQIKAAHMIGGDTGRVTQLTYSGTLEASGLAGRMLQERENSMNGYIRNMLVTLKHHAEAQTTA